MNIDFTKENIEILIVEDSITQATKLQYLIEQEGYHVSIARNGLDALVYLRGNIPAIIISDIIMPKMDGYQFCQQVKEDENLKEIPIILLSLLSSPQDIIRGLECGADRFITKPCDKEILFSIIHEILENAKLCESEDEHKGLKIFFEGQRYFVTSDRKQILGLLLSTYKDVIQKNNELKKAKKEIEKKNKELDDINRELKEENERIIAEQKNMIEQTETEPSIQSKESVKLKKAEGKRILKGLKTKYENLLDSYIKSDREKVDNLINELCNTFIQADVAPKAIVELHIVSAKKVADDINPKITQKKIITIRMVLLMVMTKYASLLRSAQTKGD